MTTTIAVTYTGSDDPFVDRIYHSGLTFANGQTRQLPVALAHRFLRHSDVFKEASEEVEKPKESAKKKGESNAGVLKKDDDTQSQLDAAASADKKREEQENARFDLLQQVERMDKTGLRDLAKVNWGQNIHHSTSLENMRDIVRGFIDQFGTP